MPDYTSSFQTLFNSDGFKLTGPRVFTIASVGKEKVGQEDKQEDKIVARFKEDERGIVLNKTRYNILAELFGSTDTDKWIGGRAEFFFDPSINRPGGGRGGIGVRE